MEYTKPSIRVTSSCWLRTTPAAASPCCRYSPMGRSARRRKWSLCQACPDQTGLNRPAHTLTKSSSIRRAALSQFRTRVSTSFFIFSFDPADLGKLGSSTVQGSAVARSGSGPRWAYCIPSPELPTHGFVLNEIGSTVATYYLEAEHGSLRPVEILPTLPSDYTGESIASEIALSQPAAGSCTARTGATTVLQFLPWMRTQAY